VRPLALTHAGAIFAEGCESLVQHYEELEAKVAGLKKDPEGLVRVSAIYSAGIDLLSRVRERFEAEHKKISVEIRYDRPEHVYQAVRDNECNMGIVSYPERWRKVDTIPLRDEVMVVVCNPRHPIAGKQKLNVRDLEKYEMVTFDNTLPVGRSLREYFKDHGIKPPISNVFDNIDTIKGALAVTEQISILPKRTVIREVTAGSLSILTITPELIRPMGVIFKRRTRHGAPFPPEAQVFADYLVAHAGPDTDFEQQIAQEGEALMGAGI
jgi:DNA-binding transcriptional LysR family regulator